MKKQRFLGEILVDLGYISYENLEKVLQEQKENQDENKYFLIGEILINKALITKEQLKDALKISLTEIIEDNETKNFIKELSQHTLKLLSDDHSFEYQNNKLTEEGINALNFRLNEFENKLESIKKEIRKNQTLKQTEFRKSLLLNYKNQIIELEKKIEMIKRDIKFFC